MSREDSAGQRLAGDMAEVVRDEVRTVRADLTEAARPAAAGLILLGAAAGLAVFGLAAASTTVSRVLEAFLPRTLASAGLTAAYLSGAAALGGAGVAQLRAAGGSSEHLADQLRDAAARAVGRPAQAAASAAHEAARSSAANP